MSRELESLDSIMTIVCKYYGLNKNEVLSPNRSRELVTARQMFCTLARTYTRSTLKMMGVYLSRNHSSVINNISKMKDLCETDREMRHDIETIVETNPELCNINNYIFNIKTILQDEITSDMWKGSSKVDTLRGVKYFELVEALGQPTQTFEEGEKSSVEWVVRFGDYYYTIYDWKTYDREYTISELNVWSIGGKSSSIAFKSSLMNLIDAAYVSIRK